MSRPNAPSMPTEHQIKKAHETVVSLHPDARIASVGPDGVKFEYPEQAANLPVAETTPLDAWRLSRDAS